MTCQSVMQPLTAEYWHIGAMTMRLANSRAPTRNGLNSALIPILPIHGVTARFGVSLGLWIESWGRFLIDQTAVMPRRPSSFASIKPQGPAPTIRTEQTLGRRDFIGRSAPVTLRRIHLRGFEAIFSRSLRSGGAPSRIRLRSQSTRPH